MPSVVVIAGPNGAGKSTAAPFLLRDTLSIQEFVNADQIAAGLSAFNPEGAAFEAGRIMLRRIRDLAEAGEDFAFETTLSSRSFAPLLATLKAEKDYRCYLIYLWLKSPKAAQARVARRVGEGGHDIPPETIERRYWRGIANFNKLYRPIADEWRAYDNSREFAPTLIARGSRGRTLQIAQPDTWKHLKGVHHENH
jgi:predicted ABC-type ATPase